MNNILCLYIIIIIIIITHSITPRKMLNLQNHRLQRFLSGVAVLRSRKFVKLDGMDAAKFLQGLTTNDIQSLHSNQIRGLGQYTSFLNAQGRLMYDAFIYRTTSDTPIYYIECDGQIQERLFLHLQTYNLRTRTNIKMVTEEEELVVAFSSVPLEGALASASDTRTNWSFTRYLFKDKDLSAILSKSQSDIVTFTEGRYNRERVMKGIPEGAFEIPSRQAIPLEFNVDLMGGIDFNKGCYLGQELVIRTHQRGVVRKRILPLRFHSLNSTTLKPERPEIFEFKGQSQITRNLDKQSEFLPTAIDPTSGKLKILSRTDSVGKLMMAQGNIGLGMMRLDALKDQQSRCDLAVLDHIESDWILADALIPENWPNNIFDNL